MKRVLLIALAAVTLLSVVSTVPGAAQESARRRPLCYGQQATIVGTSGDDTLVGTRSADVIVAKGGNDTVTGVAQGDFICGGGGNDTLDGGRGSDRANGGGGSDLCIAERMRACENTPPPEPPPPPPGNVDTSRMQGDGPLTAQVTDWGILGCPAGAVNVFLPTAIVEDSRAWAISSIWYWTNQGWQFLQWSPWFFQDPDNFDFAWTNYSTGDDTDYFEFDANPGVYWAINTWVWDGQWRNRWVQTQNGSIWCHS